MEIASRAAVGRGDVDGAAKWAMQLAGIKQEDANREFMAGRDDARRDHEVGMFGLQQQAQAERDQWQAGNAREMWTAEQGAREKAAQQQWQNHLTMFGLNQGADAMREERERAAAEEEARKRRDFGLKPVQVPGTDSPFFQDFKGSIFTGAVPAPNGPVPEGMVPAQTERNGTTYVAPKPVKSAAPPRVQAFENGAGVKEYRQWDPDKQGWTKVKFVDEDGDGIDDRTQGGGGTTKPSDAGGGKTSGFLNF